LEGAVLVAVVLLQLQGSKLQEAAVVLVHMLWQPLRLALQVQTTSSVVAGLVRPQITVAMDQRLHF